MPHFAAGQILTASEVNDIAHSGSRILDEQVPASSTSSVTFTNIDQGFRNLEVAFSGGVTTPPDQVKIRFNGDAGANYQYISYALRGDSTFAAFPGNNAEDDIQIGFQTTSDLLNASQILVYGYARTDRQKLVSGHFVNGITSSTDSDILWNNVQGYWKSTAAITSIEVFTDTAGDDFVAGSIFQLFGYGQ